MTIEATGHHGGDPKQYCESLAIHAGDWNDATRLAELNRALETPEGQERILREARLFNQGKDRWNGLLVPSQN